MAKFKDIVGQENIVEYLQNAIKTGNISHAYVITGERYAGKEFIAKVFSSAILCEAATDKPCNECKSCIQAKGGNHPDIIYVTHEKPNTVSVNDIREQINNTVLVKPYSSPYKIYIVNDAQKMNEQAQNALLKTLEEPPEYVVILLLTDNIDAMLPTVLSRCVNLTMRPVDEKRVAAFLVKELKISEDKAGICASFSRGNVGRAKMLAKSEEFDRIKMQAVTLLKNISAMETKEIMDSIASIKEYKLEIEDFLDILSVWYRDALLYKATNDMNGIIFKSEMRGIINTASKSTYEGIERVLKAMDKAKSRLSAGVNFELTIELLLLVIRENS